MTLGNSRYLIGLISLALIGSIALQVWLFSNALEVRRARFKSDVLEAMRNAGEQIEGVDAMRLLDSETNFRPWLQEQIPEVFSVVDSVDEFDLEAAEDRLLMSSANASTSDIDMDSGSFYTFRYEADTTYFSPGGPLRVEVSQEGAGRRSIDGKIKLYLGQMQRVEERVLTMDTVLQTFVRSSVRDWVPIESRFKSDLIDSIIESELAHKGIGAGYQFALQEGDYLTKLRSKDFDTTDQATYKVPIFRSDLWGSPRFLMVQFPDSEAYIYREMWAMFALGILFTIGVIVTFWSTIRQMLRQKKINSIKNDFINNMTHEFKTPLATINLAIDALNSPKLTEDAEKRKHYTNIIKKENERMHKQVEHVLQMSLLDQGDIQLKKEKIALSDLIDEACAHMTLTIEGRKGQLLSDVKPELKVSVDVHHMSNVIINILDNAVKYTTDEPRIKLWTEEEGGEIKLYIQDNGIGMTKEVKEHVFDRFYRAERGNVHTVKGHGLGLAYAKEIIDLHDGDIQVKSSAGQGSTFIITLALA